MKKLLHLFPASEQFDTMFNTERLRLEKILGEDVRIEHVGSTSVRGLGGKGIIDIAVGVSTENGLESVANKLMQAGYFPALDNELPSGRIFLASREHDSTFGDYHLHIVVSGGDEWSNFIAFRDQLNNNATLRDAYMLLKNRLLVDTNSDRREYKHLKADFIQKTLKEYYDKEGK